MPSPESPRPRQRRYDVILIGAGHNALVAAAYLARAGRRVLVLERRELIGGACVTEELWPGFKVSTASYAGSSPSSSRRRWRPTRSSVRWRRHRCQALRTSFSIT